MAELTDEQYLLLLAEHYKDSPVPEIRAHHARLTVIAARLSATGAEDAELRKKAARYDWLRQRTWFDSTLCVVQNPAHAVKLGASCPFGTMLDDAVDAAMQSNGAAGGGEVSHG